MLLFAAVQGAWADKWDGSSTSKPGYCAEYRGGARLYEYYLISSAAELAYIAEHWDDPVPDDRDFDFYEFDYVLNADLDMTAATWIPMGGARYKGTFDGNGHTIRIKIDDSGISSNYQGLFETIAKDGTVKNLHVDGKIKVGNSRQVGGIAGNNYGTIENCWVSADLETSHYDISKDADLGGITGWNESDGTVRYCCMTGNVTNTGGNAGVGGIAGTNKGTIQHVTFFGSVSVDHKQDNKWVGDQDKTLENNYDSFSQSEYDAASGNDMYRRVIKYCSLPNPFVISSNADWDGFLDYVNHCCGFRGKSVRLDGDISTSAIMSDSEMNAFQGTFDGNAHNINVSINNGGDGAALFRHINGATIKNLRMTGSVSGGRYTAGLVGFVNGTGNSIDGCVVWVNVTGNDNRVGGMVGYARRSGITVNGCVFKGPICLTGHKISGQYSTGVFIGWADSGDNQSVNDCFFVPVQGYSNAYYGLNLSWYGSHTNNYTTSHPGMMAATQVNPAIPAGIGKLVKDYGMVRAYEHGIWYDDQYYVDIRFSLAGAGTEEDPVHISSVADWGRLANAVNGGYTFNEHLVMLHRDISVSDMVGSSDANSFQGTFDGDGHTLTFTNGSADRPFAEDYCAPFRHVKNAVIKNLYTDGTITTSAMKGAGLVGESHGALTIENCRSSVTISASKSGDGTHGGFVATLSGKDNAILIDGCVFDGSFTSTSGTNGCGGFIGWPVYNKPAIRNSLMIPESVSAGMLENTFTRWHSGYEPAIDNSFFVGIDNLPFNQGTKATSLATAPGSLGDLVKDYGMVKAYENGLFFDGKYYVNASLGLSEGSDNGSTISDLNGAIVDVTLTGCTFYKDGAWNTICLPFNLTLAGSPLDGAVARPLTGAGISGSSLNLTFGDAVTQLTAGTPYLIKWEGGENIVNPVFNGVTIDATDRSFDNGAQGADRVRFIGVYKSIAFDGEDKSVLLLGGANTLYHPVGGAGVGALRAYFKIGDGATKATISVKGSVLTVNGE